MLNQNPYRLKTKFGGQISNLGQVLTGAQLVVPVPDLVGFQILKLVAQQVQRVTGTGPHQLS
jgi:hypothetical protein